MENLAADARWRPSAPTSGYENRLFAALKKFEEDVSKGQSLPNYENAYDVCDSGRSVFGAYVVEFELNGASRFRRQVEDLMLRAQNVLDRASRHKCTTGDELVYVLEFSAHNQERLEVLRTLHKDGRVAAESLLLAD